MENHVAESIAQKHTSTVLQFDSEFAEIYETSSFLPPQQVFETKAI